MNKTNIPWATHSWNPISGCSPESTGCDHCYAAAMSKRFNLPWGEPVYHHERLSQPMAVKNPARIFVCSMSDLFHGGVRRLWQNGIMATIRANPKHTFIILTKRPHNIDIPMPVNVWLGVTAENQEMLESRWETVSKIPASVRFISAEPLLETITIRDLAVTPSWVIAGPENGPRARRVIPMVFHSLAYECKKDGIPFFDKRETFISREYPEVLS